MIRLQRCNAHDRIGPVFPRLGRQAVDHVAAYVIKSGKPCLTDGFRCLSKGMLSALTAEDTTIRFFFLDKLGQLENIFFAG